GYMKSRPHSASVITGSFIVWATNWSGGKTGESIHSRLPRASGIRRIRNQRQEPGIRSKFHRAEPKTILTPNELSQANRSQSIKRAQKHGTADRRRQTTFALQCHSAWAHCRNGHRRPRGSGRLRILRGYDHCRLRPDNGGGARTCPSPGECLVALASRDWNRNRALSICHDAIRPVSVENDSPGCGCPIAVRSPVVQQEQPGFE